RRRQEAAQGGGTCTFSSVGATRGASAQGAQPVAEQLDAGLAGLLGVELGGRQRAVLDGGDEGGAVLGPRDERALERRAGLEVRRRVLLDGVGVDEVEALVLQPVEQGAALGRTDGRP